MRKRDEKKDEKRGGQVRGQSLVELAIAFPILLMFFVGLIEVGWALHSYLVVTNANREGARFAARGQHFYGTESNDVTNQVIAERVWVSLRQEISVMETSDDPPQLVKEGGNLTIFVHRFYIATNDPDIPTDDTIRINDSEPAQSCTGIDPLPPSHHMGAVTNSEGVTQTSRIDLVMYCLELVEENDEFNDQLDELYPDQNIPYSVNEVIVVETIYQHEMAMKVPFFTAIIPDPIPLYINTQMRISGEMSLAE